MLSTTVEKIAVPRIKIQANMTTLVEGNQSLLFQEEGMDIPAVHELLSYGSQGDSSDEQTYKRYAMCETPINTKRQLDARRRENESIDVKSESGKRKKGTRRGSLNNDAKRVLKKWMFSKEHIAHPYPNEEEKEILAYEAGIDLKQLSNWFTNARKRLWQPVLRSSGVEVKNFLSTGRGGPRGNKLEVPENIDALVTKHTPEKTNRSSKKRSVEQSRGLRTFPNKLKLKPAAYHESLLSRGLDNHRQKEATMAIKNGFKPKEICAAESLLGLSLQCQFVH